MRVRGSVSNRPVERRAGAAAPGPAERQDPPRSPDASSPASPAVPGRCPRPPGSLSHGPWSDVSSLPGTLR